MYAKILLVDDDINMCELLLDLLKDEEYHVELASSAEEALEKIQEVAFDLIISDIKMPGMNGLKLLEEIRTMGVDSAVVFITGYSSVSSAVEAMKINGVENYIEKPFNFRWFKHLVSQVLHAQDCQCDKLLKE